MNESVSISTPHEKIAGLILAGGQSSRMQGRDKGLQRLNQQSLVEHVLSRLQPQVRQIWLCANRNIEQYQSLGLPVFSDDADFLGMGPLAGIASFAEHLSEEYTHVQLAPCDTPFIPEDLTARLYAVMHTHGAQAAFPKSVESAHYSCALFHRSLLTAAVDALNNEQRSLHCWLAQQHALAVEGFDEAAFTNINTPEQLQLHTQRFGIHHA